MNCADCGTALEVADLDHIKIHECPKCAAMWFEQDELRRAKDNADEWIRWIDFDLFAAADASGEIGSKPCPECGQPMRTLVYPHSKIEVDACTADHGVFLDKEEFDKIVTSLDDLTNQVSAKDLEHATWHQFKEIFAGGHESRVSEIKDFMAVFRLMEMRFGVEHPATAQAINVLSREGL
ncbi:MAG: hypothetical protein QOJ00_1468 [Actinomycetota bacterium]|jgi:Zn-finger nucleic acid-binding protein